MKSKILIFVLIFNFLFQYSFAETSSKLSISDIDKNQIARLFSFLMFDEKFAFVLFGSKPMATIGFEKSTPLILGFIYPSIFFELESLWHTWEKYYPLFMSNNYQFVINDNDQWFQIYLVNKSLCIKHIEQNISLFQKEMGDLSGYEVLNKILSSNDVFATLNKNQTLYGILLGYGSTNANAFHQKYSKNHFYLEGIQFNDEPSLPFMLGIPNFVVFKSNDEVKEIKMNYLNERENILDIYSKGDFLEITLQKLSEKNK